MKRNNFSQPSRQSYVAILVIIYNLYKRLIRQFWPFLLLALANVGREGRIDKTLYYITVAAIISSIFRLWSFFKYYFFIENGELIVEKGIFQKSKTSIPFERIQSINFEQAVIHRIFDVVKVKIDTAGSSGNELSLHALSKSKASELRDHILSEKRENTILTQVDESATDYSTTSVIMKVAPSNLLKIGAVENHIQSGFLILFFGFWVFDQIKELGFVDPYNQVEANWESIITSVAIMITLVCLFAIASFLLSIVRVFFRYYDLKLERVDHGFRLTYGLLNQKQTTAKDHKIQTLAWVQNWLQHKANLFKLSLKQASTKEVSTAKSINVPGCNGKQKNQVFEYLLGEHYIKLKSTTPRKPNKHMFYYAARNRSIFVIPLIFTFFYYGIWPGIIFVLAALIFSIMVSHKKFKKKKYRITDEILQLEGGIFGFAETVLELHKIQTVIMKQSWYQSRRELADVIVTTAAQNVRIPFVQLADAQSIMDKLLYHVESSKKPWM